jgi:PAS domain S-box-containing protein
MDGKTYAYLDLVALPAVGRTLLDPGPAFVFSGDGRSILFANAAGAAFFGETAMGQVLQHHFSASSPLQRQLSRMARLLPTENARMEILRFSLGVTQATLACACRRINLSDRTSAVLAIAAASDRPESVVTRAERLADTIAGEDCLVAVMARDGHVLGASGGFTQLSQASEDIDNLIAAVAGGSERLVKRSIKVGASDRPAGMARFGADGDPLFLLIVGPKEGGAAAVPTAPLPASSTVEREGEIERALGEISSRRAAPIEPARDPLPSVSPSPPPTARRDAPPPPPLPVTPPAAESPVEEPAEEPQTGDDLDDVARLSVEQGPRLVISRDQAPPAAAPARSNVVHLPGATAPVRGTPPERLSGLEQDAFRRIAEALGVQPAEPPKERNNDRPAVPAQGGTPPEAPGSRTAPTGREASEIDARLLDRLPIGLIIFRERKTLFANKAALDLLGYASLTDFIAAGGAEDVFRDGEQDWVKTDSGGRQMTAKRLGGGSVPVEARLHSISWGGGAALMLLIREMPPALRVSPVAEKLASELVATENRIGELEAILDTATDGVIVVEGGGRIVNVNRSAEALFGIEAKEVIGRAFTDLFAEESRKAALDYLDGLAANGVASVLNDGREVIGKVPQGGLIPLFMTMGRLPGTGKFCAVLRDITQWKNAEEELVASRRAAEAANAQKSDFLAKISHEIRTPLNAIIGFSEVMMEERFGPIGNERYRDYLRDIHVSGAHLMSLINDLLDLSKIEAGKLELSFESVAVNEVIQECVALMQPQANRERIIIRTSLAADVPNVVADLRSLRQILLNLLSNAIKFTQPGGQVIVSTSLEEKGEVVIRIRDTGIGMSEKDIETALKPFRQLATTGRGRAEGTGLGLPLTKALTEANRATFSIDSAVNQGTLVRITFPTTRVLAG